MIHLDGLLNINYGFGQNCKFIFFTIFLNSAFHLVFLIATTNMSFYCSHFECPKIWHADVSWPLQNSRIRFWSSSVDFSHFGVIFTKWNRPNLQLMDIFWRMHGRNGLNFGMLMYPDHLQNLLNFVPGLLIFLVLASFWLSETGQIWGLRQFSSECMGGMACNWTCWCILTTFSLFNCLHFGHGLWIFLILAGIWLSETSQNCSFQAYFWECIRGIGWTNLVISKEMEMANFSTRKLYSHPDCCVVRLF